MKVAVLCATLLASDSIAATAGAAVPDLVTLDVCALVPGDDEGELRALAGLVRSRL